MTQPVWPCAYALSCPYLLHQAVAALLMLASLKLAQKSPLTKAYGEGEVYRASGEVNGRRGGCSKVAALWCAVEIALTVPAPLDISRPHPAYDVVAAPGALPAHLLSMPLLLLYHGPSSFSKSS